MKEMLFELKKLPLIKSILFTIIFCFSLGQCYPATEIDGAQIPVIKDFRQLSSDLKGREIKMQGEILSYTQSKGEPVSYIISLSDGFLTIPVILQASLEPSVPADAKIVGTIIEVQGIVDQYANAIILRIQDPANITIVGKSVRQPVAQLPSEQIPTPSPTPDINTMLKLTIAQIDQSAVGKWVLLKGEVSGFTSPWSDKAPNKITLDDGTKSITVVYWSDVSSAMPRIPKKGDKMQIIGQMQIYRNEYQIRVIDPRHISFLNGNGSISKDGDKKVSQSIAQQPIQPIQQSQKQIAQQAFPQSTSSPQSSTKSQSSSSVSNSFADMPSINSQIQSGQTHTQQSQHTQPNTVEQITPISQINTSQKDKVLTIKGEIYSLKESTASDSPYFIYITDGTGNFTVAYWNDVAVKIKSDQMPSIGKKAQITGRVNVHQGVAWIKLENPDNLKILH